jgi:hypothetical protein
MTTVPRFAPPIHFTPPSTTSTGQPPSGSPQAAADQTTSAGAPRAGTYRRSMEGNSRAMLAKCFQDTLPHPTYPYKSSDIRVTVTEVPADEDALPSTPVKAKPAARQDAKPDSKPDASPETKSAEKTPAPPLSRPAATAGTLSTAMSVANSIATAAASSASASSIAAASTTANPPAFAKMITDKPKIVSKTNTGPLLGAAYVTHHDDVVKRTMVPARLGKSADKDEAVDNRINYSRTLIKEKGKPVDMNAIKTVMKNSRVAILESNAGHDKDGFSYTGSIFEDNDAKVLFVDGGKGSYKKVNEGIAELQKLFPGRILGHVQHEEVDRTLNAGFWAKVKAPAPQ